MGSRQRNNVPGAAEQTLRAVKNLVAQNQYAVKSGKDRAGYDEVVRCISEEIRASQADAGRYDQQLLSKSIDNILDRVVYELNQRETAASFTEQQLAGIKQQVLDAFAENAAPDENTSDEKILKTLQSIQDFLTGGEQADAEPAAEGEPLAEDTQTAKTFDNFAQFQKYINSAVATFQSNIKLIGANLKNHYLFNYKNPFIQSISKVKDPFVEINKKLDSIDKSMKISMFAAVGGFFISVFKNFGGLLSKATKGLLGGISKLGKRMWGALKSPFAGIFKKVQAIGGAVSAGLKGFGQKFKGIGAGIKGLGGKMMSGLRGFGQKFKGIGVGIKGLSGKLVSGLKGFGRKFKGIGAGIKGLGGKMMSGLSGFGRAFKGIGAGIKGLGGKLTSGLKGFGAGIWNRIKSPFTKSAKEKKEDKQNRSTFAFLGKTLDKIKKVFSNIGNFVVGVFASIVVPVMKLIAKAIGIILQPVLTFILGAIWGSGIGFVLIALAIAVPLIAIAVKEFVEWMRDDVWPTIDDFIRKLKPETINKVLDAAAGFLNTFTAVINALFAPLILIGTAIKGALDPLCDFVRNTLYSIVNAAKPVIDKICNIVSGVIMGILNGIDPLIKAIEPIVRTISEIISGTVMMALDGIKFVLDLIQPIVEALKPLLELVRDVLVDTIQVVVEGIKIVVDWVKEKLAYIRDHWDEIVEFIKSLPGKIWDFICEIPGMVWTLIKKIPSMVVNIFKKALDVGKIVLGKIRKAAEPLADIGFHLPWPLDADIKPFSWLKGGSVDVSSDQPQDMEVDVDMPDVDMSQPDTINKITAQEEIDTGKAEDNWAKLDRKQDEILQNWEDLIPYLENAFGTIATNFQKISEKLDNPQLMPLPMPSRNTGFMTENR